MNLTLSIQGPQAVGKTTVLQQLAEKLPDLHVVFENPQPIVNERARLGLDIRQYEGFIANQRLFIQAEIDRCRALPGGVTLFDRGPEDTECYTLNYPRSIGMSWDVASALAPELEALREYRSKRILFMDADDDVLVARKENDPTRSRRSFDLSTFRIFRAWYRERSDTDFIDVSHLSTDQTLLAVEKWVLANSDLESN